MADNGLTEAQIENVLLSQRTIRVGFAANGEVFVVPMGYAWFDGALHGMTTGGRKLDMAEVSSKIAFQIDTSSETGTWSWHSVAGEGMFEVIKLPRAALLMPKILSKFKDVPLWFQAAQAAEVASGALVAWRIKPTKLTGRSLGKI